MIYPPIVVVIGIIVATIIITTLISLFLWAFNMPAECSLPRNPPTLTKDVEKIWYQLIVNELQQRGDTWKSDGLVLSNGKLEIWIANAPHSDMELRKPFRIFFSKKTANKLREKCAEWALSQVLRT